MFSITSRLNFTKPLGSMMMLGIMLFLCTTYVYAGQVSLAWDANTESTLGGYELYYGQASGNYTGNVDVANQTGYTFANLPDGTYYFAVKAYDTPKTTWSGYSNEVSKTISSTTAPTANFTANPVSGTAPLTVTFTDTSTGNITDRSWNFGDGSTGSGTTAMKTYSNPGTYTVSLTVSGPGGSNTKTQSISATTATPVANFSAMPTTGTAPLAVSFTNSSTGNVTSYSWNFGDGSTSTSTNPSHTYSTVGTYTVGLTATGSGGTNTKTQTAYITVSLSTGGGGNSGLVAAYNFEEASGTTVVDASGKGNHGTISGAAQITSGKFGRGLSFDGINDKVTVQDAASLVLTTGMTLEAWVYPTAVPSNWRTVIHKEVDRYFLMAGSNAGVPAAGGTYPNGMNILYVPAPPLAVNAWTHLAATYDGARIRFYVNSSEVASQARSGALATSAGSLSIGGTAAYGEFFKGQIDEIRIYNRALSTAEISTDRNTSVASSSPPISFIGTNTVGPISDSLPAKQAQAFQNVAAKTGKVTSLSVYVDAGSAATDLVVGLYSNQSGHPYQLLGQGTLTNPTTGHWNNVVLPAISVTSGTQYWIAILSANTGTLRFRDAAAVTAQPSETSNQATLTTLPSTWSTGTVYNEGPLSAYGAGYP